MHTSALRTLDLGSRLDGALTDGAETLDDRPVVDLVHLARQTLGDRDLEVELLGLFNRQARALVMLLDTAALTDGRLPSWGATPLHTLCGSARAVGCWSVARVAEILDRDLRRAAADGSEPPRAERLGPLKAAVGRACAAIDHMLGE